MQNPTTTLANENSTQPTGHGLRGVAGVAAVLGLVLLGSCGDATASDAMSPADVTTTVVQRADVASADDELTPTGDDDVSVRPMRSSSVDTPASTVVLPSAADELPIADEDGDALVGPLPTAPATTVAPAAPATTVQAAPTTTAGSGGTDTGGSASTVDPNDPGQWVVVNVVIGDVLNARSGPGVSNGEVFSYAPGTVVNTTGNVATVGSTEWREVSVDAQGTNDLGWVNGNFLNPLGNPCVPEVDNSQLIAATITDSITVDIDGNGQADQVHLYWTQTGQVRGRVELASLGTIDQPLPAPAGFMTSPGVLLADDIDMDIDGDDDVAITTNGGATTDATWFLDVDGCNLAPLKYTSASNTSEVLVVLAGASTQYSENWFCDTSPNGAQYLNLHTEQLSFDGVGDLVETTVTIQSIGRWDMTHYGSNAVTIAAGGTIPPGGPSCI